MKQRKPMKLTTRNAWEAQIFLLPFYLGLIFFFLVPLFTSIHMSFSDISVDISGYKFDFVGFKNYNTAFNVDPDFKVNLIASFLNLLWQTPVINIFAIFLALIINQKFKGRVAVRAIFFLPLVFASSIAFSIILGDSIASSAMSGQEVSGGTVSTGAIEELLVNSGLSRKIIDVVTGLSDSLFSMAWSCGVQMLLYLAGLQSISPSLYEASSIEGASKWDDFWKITLPMLIPIIVVCLVYTVVDSFTNTENLVMNQIVTVSQNNLTQMGVSAAFAWSYFILILLVLGAVALIFKLLGSDRKRGRN